MKIGTTTKRKYPPTYLDRYPAKMVSHLAERLTKLYIAPGSRLFDPFCGSGAILEAVSIGNAQVTGLDVNPYATLLSRVKLEGFDSQLANELCHRFLRIAVAKSSTSLPVNWDAKSFWFTRATLLKYERLRYAANELGLRKTREGRAVLLAYALSIRRCSRADQRSPKPFISKTAVATRKGKHFDPTSEIPLLLGELGKFYGKRQRRHCRVLCSDLRTTSRLKAFRGSFTHIITSPPYVNAQDYFRNFKLELHLLEGLLPFRVGLIKHRFIGTERGSLTADLRECDLKYHRKLLPRLCTLEETHLWHAAVIHRYLFDMGQAFKAMKKCLMPEGKLVIVCGDNLIAGYRVPTWKTLNRMLEDLGFQLQEQFGDKIDRRNVPPKRQGHKGLIKQEVVSVFVRI